MKSVLHRVPQRRLRMATRRPFGITLIAAYLILKAVALLMAMAVVHLSSVPQPIASELVSAVSLRIHIPLPFPTALLSVTVGLGIWFLKKWARTVIVVVNTYALCRMAVGSAILMAIDRKFLISQTSSPYFALNLIAGIAILVYLLDPE